MSIKFAFRGRWLRPIVWVNSTAEQRLRYEIPMKALRNSKGSILEVGSSTHGITRFMSIPITGVDVAFGRINMGWLTRVSASACQLPFQDDAFENVVSVDMLEHLYGEDRKQALRELVRVAAKRLILLVPCGESKYTDQRLAKTLKRFGVPAWLQEHLKYDLPACEAIEAMIRELLAKKGKRHTLQIYGNVNRTVWYWLALTSHVPILRYVIHLPLLMLAPLIVHFVDGEPCYRKVFDVSFDEA